MLSNVTQLVSEFGGVKPFAEALGLKSVPPVYRAMSLNHIPHKWRIPVLQETKRRRLSVAPYLLGLEREQ